MASVPENVQRGDKLKASEVRELAKLAKRGARPIRVTENSGLTIREDISGTTIGLDLRKAFVKQGTTTTEPPATSGLLGKRCVIKSVESEYLRCRAKNGTQELPGDILVARPWFLRGPNTWQNKQRRGITYSYLADTQRRTATSATGNETQVIVPRYSLEDEIEVVQGVSTGVYVVDPDLGFTELRSVDLNVDGRMWAKEVL